VHERKQARWQTQKKKSEGLRLSSGIAQAPMLLCTCKHKQDDVMHAHLLPVPAGFAAKRGWAPNKQPHKGQADYAASPASLPPTRSKAKQKKSQVPSNP
jgi:hypothetical protein